MNPRVRSSRPVSTRYRESQSSDPESPYFADQTELYGRKEWVFFPYCYDQIEAGRIGDVLVVEE